MRAIITLIAVTSLALVPGCKDSNKPAAVEAPTEGKSVTTEANPVAPAPKPAEVSGAIKHSDGKPETLAGAPQVKLIDAGGQPRTPLRLKATEGARQDTEMTMKMTMTMGVGGQKIPMKLPAMKMGMSVGVGSVNKAGDADYSFTIDRAEVVDEPGAMPATVTAMKEGIAGIVGMKGSATVSNRGYTKAADFKMPPNVAPQMRQMMDGFKQSLNQMSTPLPEEAVGPGAKWQVIQSIDQNGMKIDQTATFELIEVTGSVARTKFTIAQSADAQDIKTPDMPPGVTARLVSLKGSGSGDTELDLTRIMPTKSSAKVTSSVKMSTQGQTVDLDMTIDMDLATK